MDLNRMRELTVNDKEMTAVLGAGQRLGPIYAALTAAGYTIPAGACAGVGISGLTLGGGLGHAMRSLGVMADSVLGATVVLSSGQVMTANSSSEPDLFWAIRGGGPVYGIVTSWRVQLHKAPEKVSIVELRQACTESKLVQLLKAWNAWAPWRLSKEYAYVNLLCGHGEMVVQIWYWGNLADLMTTVKASPVHALEGFKISSKEVSSWSDFVVRVITNVHGSKDWSWKHLEFRSGAQNQGSFAGGSLLARSPMSSDAITAMAKAIVGSQQHAFIQGKASGGALSAVPEAFNAFPWRKALYEFQVFSNGGSADREFVDSTLSTVQPLINSYGELYNYFHCTADPWSTFFGAHAERLQQIKQKYDPGNQMGGLYCQEGVEGGKMTGSNKPPLL